MSWTEAFKREITEDMGKESRYKAGYQTGVNDKKKGVDDSDPKDNPHWLSGYKDAQAGKKSINEAGNCKACGDPMVGASDKGKEGLCSDCYKHQNEGSGDNFGALREGSRPEFYIVRKADGKAVSEPHRDAGTADKDLASRPGMNTKTHQVVDGRYLSPKAFSLKEADSPEMKKAIAKTKRNPHHDVNEGLSKRDHNKYFSSAITAKKFADDLSQISGITSTSIKKSGDGGAYVFYEFLGVSGTYGHDVDPGMKLYRKMTKNESTWTEAVTLSKDDKKVIDAFTDGRPGSSNKLTTNGKRLDGNWMGGNEIAVRSSGGRITFQDVGSKAGQTVQRAVRKSAAPDDVSESVKSAFNHARKMADQGMTPREIANAAAKKAGLDSGEKAEFFKKLGIRESWTEAFKRDIKKI